MTSAPPDPPPPPDKKDVPLTLHEAITRFNLIQTPEEQAFLKGMFNRLQAALSFGVPTPEMLWTMYAEIWDQARVAGAVQMRRAIQHNISIMANEPPPPPEPKYPPPPAPVLVEAMDRYFCHECEKEAN